MDLSQAEAVMDLIGARSESALAAANQQLRGSLGRTMNELTERLLAVIARIEAYIDFPEEDLPPEDRDAVARDIDDLARATERLLATSHYGELLRDGIKTVIVGAPNAGKSSVLNRLVGRDRALVSPEPGTTRDFIEERINVGGHLLRVIDTAGLNPSPSPLEKLGMEKTMERVAEADIFLVVLDSTQPPPVLPAELVPRLRVGNTLVLANKSDLIVVGAPVLPPLEVAPTIRLLPVSAKTGSGFEGLTSCIKALADAIYVCPESDLVVSNARHADALVQAKVCLSEASGKVSRNGATELLASDLRGALDAYAEILGKVDNERVLDYVFSSFCIGK